LAARCPGAEENDGRPLANNVRQNAKRSSGLAQQRNPRGEQIRSIMVEENLIDRGTKF